jgi:hypothetical protein
LFQILQEESNQVRRNIDHCELVDFFSRISGNEWKQQAKRVPVTPLRVSGQISFAHQILKKKTPDP